LGTNVAGLAAWRPFMKLIGATFAIATCCAVAAGAQEIKKTTQQMQTIEIKSGKPVAVTGCVNRSTEGHYVLMNDSGDLKYVLVTDDNLTPLIRHLVEVKGLATDKGDAKVTIKKTVGTTGEVAGRKLDGPKRTTKTELAGDIEMPYLGVKSIRQLADSCK
jgi:hypothetical protein